MKFDATIRKDALEIELVVGEGGVKHETMYSKILILSL